MLKKAMINMLKNRVAKTPEQLVAVLEEGQYKVVSFDIFDTLMKRSLVAPKDVFLLLEHHYQQQFGNNDRISELREQAESRAAKQAHRKEVCFQEIYDAMEELSPENRQWLMREEIRIEHTVCECCQPMSRAYEWCLQRGLPVILISDMYLPYEVIAGLLHAAGYTGWRRLYISAEEQGNKADGTLFDIALREENLVPRELLHIGDSLRGDYLTPKRKGIQAFLVATSAPERKI